MLVLLIYGSVEGQTRKIARNIAGSIQSRGHDVMVFDAVDVAEADLDAFNAVIVAAPIHLGAVHQGVAAWLTENGSKLSGMPTAFISVSLSAASSFPEEHADLHRIVDDTLARAGWTPRAIHHAAGALRYTRYDFLKRLLMRYIAGKEGGATDTTNDHEYTDWTALDAFVGDFLASSAKDA